MTCRTLSATALLAIGVATAAAPTVLRAQSIAPKQQVLSIQPISSIVGFYSAEYERVVGVSTTLGIGASYLDEFLGDDGNDNPHYFSTEGKFRFYPGAQPLTGFSFGGTIGYTRVSDEQASFCDVGGCTSSRESASGPSVGFQLDYSWLLGKNQNFAVSLGAGGKRLFISDDDTNATLAYPTARISVGIAF